MLIVYIVSFLKAFAFAGVAKQGKDAAVLALDNDAGGVDPPGVRGAVSVDPSSEGAKMRRASLMGSFVFKTAPAARIIVTKILNV